MRLRRKRESEPEMGLLGANVAVTLAANGIDEDEAIHLGYMISGEFGYKTPTEKTTREIIRRVQELTP